jgi:hypothetical protein
MAFLDPVETVNGALVANPSGNILLNGQLDWATSSVSANGSLTNISTCGTSGSGTSASNYVPASWSLSADANTATAITNGTLLVTCGYGTAPNGQPGFFVMYYGATGSGPSFTLQQNLNGTTSTYAASDFIAVNTSQTRGYMQIAMTRGPADSDGMQRIYGFSSPTFTQTDNMSATGNVFGVPCPTSACKTTSGEIADFAGYYNTKSLIDDGGTAMQYNWTTPLANVFVDTTGGQTLTSASVKATLGLGANSPVSGKFWFQNAALRAVSH